MSEEAPGLSAILRRSRRRVTNDRHLLADLDAAALAEVGQARAEQRNGPTGQVTLTFIKQFMRFENFAVAEPFGFDS